MTKAQAVGQPTCESLTRLKIELQSPVAAAEPEPATGMKSGGVDLAAHWWALREPGGRLALAEGAVKWPAAKVGSA